MLASGIMNPKETKLKTVIAAIKELSKHGSFSTDDVWLYTAIGRDSLRRVFYMLVKKNLLVQGKYPNTWRRN